MSSTSLKRFEFKSDYHLNSITICIPEVLDQNYGLYVWPCAPVLAQYVWKNKDRIKGCNVLEVRTPVKMLVLSVSDRFSRSTHLAKDQVSGAGTSLPGILAAKLGANVTLSDALHLPRCIENCQKACAANNLNNIRVIGLTWGQFSPDLVQIGPVDIILGSDCFYDSKDFEDIIVTVSYLLGKNPQCEFWTTYQERSSDRTILPLLEKWNLYSTAIPLKDFDAAQRNLAGSTLPGDHTIHMLVIRRKA